MCCEVTSPKQNNYSSPKLTPFLKLLNQKILSSLTKIRSVLYVKNCVLSCESLIHADYGYSETKDKCFLVIKFPIDYPAYYLTWAILTALQIRLSFSWSLVFCNICHILFLKPSCSLSPRSSHDIFTRLYTRP